ncbi:MAG: family peptidase [Gemmatimonadetes bacterium]|nr:family peptidase [Gemmatimonadota bacterium]
MLTRQSFTALLLLPLVSTSVRGRASASPASPWTLSSLHTGDYEAAIDSAVAHSGRASARLSARTAIPYGVETVTQPLRADSYRGRRVRLSGFVKTRDVAGVGAHLSLSVNTASPIPLLAPAEDSALTGTSEWTRRAVELTVPANALGLNVGVTLNGSGSAWADDLTLEVLGPADSSRAVAPPAAPVARFASLPDTPTALDFEGVDLGAPEPPAILERPRATSTRGMENLAALARLLGVVRYFHPSDGVRTANWDDVAVRGVRMVEGAPTRDSLASALRTLFRDVAPGVSIYPTGRRVPATAGADTGRAAGVVSWLNQGLEMDGAITATNSYRSGLVTVPAPGGVIPRGTPNPGLPWSGQLGAGLSASVPLARLVELPRDDSLRARRIQPAVATIVTSPNDRASRIAGVIVAWNAVRHGFPYFDVVKVDWNAALRPAMAKAARDSSPADYWATLFDLMGRLPDGHGNALMQAAPYKFGFLPFSVDWIEQQLVITQVSPGAPAELQRGTVIESIDGVPSGQVLSSRERRLPGATAGWRRTRSLLDLPFARRDSSITVRVRAPGAASSSELRLAYSGRARVTEPALPAIREVSEGVMYVDLARTSDPQLSAAMPKLLAAKGLIVDIRNHPRANTMTLLSHLSSDTLLSDHFESPLIREPDGRMGEFVDNPWVIPPQAPRYAGKLAVLVGPAAVSSSESTLGIVEHYHLGALVGAPSAGTNGNVNMFWVPGRYQVVFTGMRVRKRNGGVHHGVGVQPTIPVARTIRGVIEGRDEVLERAIAEVRGM